MNSGSQGCGECVEESEWMVVGESVYEVEWSGVECSGVVRCGVV